MERQATGGREDLLPAHPILCQSSLAQVQARYACASSFLPLFVISFVHNLLFHSKTIQNLMNAKASPRPFGVLPSRLGAYSPSSALPSLLARHSIIAGKFVICYGWPVKCYARLAHSVSTILDLRRSRMKETNEEKKNKKQNREKRRRLNQRPNAKYPPPSSQFLSLASNRSEGKKNNVLVATVLSFPSPPSLPQLLTYLASLTRLPFFAFFF